MKTLLISGISGKMGREIYTYSEHFSFSTVCGVDKKTLFNFEYPCPIYYDFDEVKENIEMIIDFSANSLTEIAVRFATKNNIPIVIGTTALSNKTIELIKSCSKSIPICLSANYSKGINAFMQGIQYLNVALNDFDKNIIEVHHKEKKDTPSGTAKQIAELLDISDNALVHSLRCGKCSGVHTVCFSGDSEEIIITHRAYNRSGFAKGALTAATKLSNKKSGLYSFIELTKE